MRLIVALMIFLIGRESVCPFRPAAGATDIIGISCDREAQNHHVDLPTGIHHAYLIASNLSTESGMSDWECQVLNDGPLTVRECNGCAAENVSEALWSTGPIPALRACARDAARRPPCLRPARLSGLSAIRGSEALRDALDQALRARMGLIRRTKPDTFSAAQPMVCSLHLPIRPEQPILNSKPARARATAHRDMGVPSQVT